MYEDNIILILQFAFIVAIIFSLVAAINRKDTTTKINPVTAINSYVMAIHYKGGLTVCSGDTFAHKARKQRLKREMKINTVKQIQLV